MHLGRNPGPDLRPGLRPCLNPTWTQFQTLTSDTDSDRDFGLVLIRDLDLYCDPDAGSGL